MAPERFRRILESSLDCSVTSTSPPEADPDVDYWFDVHVADDTWRLAIEHKSSVPSQVGRIRSEQDELRARWPGAVPVLAIPRSSAKERQALRKDRVNHMDLAGNVWIRSPGLIIQMEGARPAPLQRPSPGRNPFSKKASLISRVLLAHPSANWRVRDIAEEAALSVGYASEVLQSLITRGYATETPDGCRLADPVALLAEWVGVYRWEDNQIHSLVVSLAKAKLVERTCEILGQAGSESFLTMLSAVDTIMDVVQHDQVHLYVPELAPETIDALRTSLQAEPVQRGGNLHVMKPYYGKAIRYGAEPVDGANRVSDVQLFLDLIHYPVRGPEAAEVLLRNRLGPRLGLSSKQLSDLRNEVGL